MAAGFLAVFLLFCQINLQNFILIYNIQGVFNKRRLKMDNKTEIRFQIIKAMLDEFPELKQKVKEYVC